MISRCLGIVAVAVLCAPLDTANTATTVDRRIELVAQNTAFKIVRDRPPKGENSKGDVTTGRDKLRNAAPQFGKQKGALVGHDTYRTVFESAKIALVEVKTALPDGTITCRGKTDVDRENVLTVVSGTAAYARAIGRCIAKSGPSDDVRIVFLLRLRS